MMNCIICNKPGCQRHAKAGWICGDCFKACGGMSNWFTIRKMSADEIRAMVEENGQVAPAPA